MRTEELEQPQLDGGLRAERLTAVDERVGRPGRRARPRLGRGRRAPLGLGLGRAERIGVGEECDGEIAGARELGADLAHTRGAAVRRWCHGAAATAGG